MKYLCMYIFSFLIPEIAPTEGGFSKVKNTKADSSDTRHASKTTPAGRVSVTEGKDLLNPISNPHTHNVTQGGQTGDILS